MQNFKVSLRFLGINIAVAILVVGCSTPQIIEIPLLSDAEIAQLNDEEHFCAAYRTYGTSDIRLVKKAQKLNYNCDIDFQSCKKAGFKSGTEAMALCLNGKRDEINQKNHSHCKNKFYRNKFINL